MVVMASPSVCTAKMVQNFTARPLTCTTQAPHWLVSQPTCVPVRCIWSRKKCTSRVRSSTSACAGAPFTVTDKAVMHPPFTTLEHDGKDDQQNHDDADQPRNPDLRRQSFFRWLALCRMRRGHAGN